MNKITAASIPNAASEAGPETARPPATAPAPPTEQAGLPVFQESYPGESGNSAVRPRNQQATMQHDWEWLLDVLKMIHDRALTGTPLHLRHPAWVSPSADCAMTMRNGIVRMIDDIFSTAVVEREDGR